MAERTVQLRNVSVEAIKQFAVTSTKESVKLERRSVPADEAEA